jgi:hypothetical protein
MVRFTDPASPAIQLLPFPLPWPAPFPIALPVPIPVPAPFGWYLRSRPVNHSGRQRRQHRWQP